jgi:hypothetical protein
MLFELLIGSPLKVRLILKRRLRKGQAPTAKDLLGRGGVAHVDIFIDGFWAVREGGLFLHGCKFTV